MERVENSTNEPNQGNKPKQGSEKPYNTDSAQAPESPQNRRQGSPDTSIKYAEPPDAKPPAAEPPDDPTKKRNPNIVKINRLLARIDSDKFTNGFLGRLIESGAFEFNQQAPEIGQIVDSNKALEILNEMIEEYKRQKILKAFEGLVDLYQLDRFSDELADLDANLNNFNSLSPDSYEDIIQKLRLKFNELCNIHEINEDTKNKIYYYIESLNGSNPLYQIRSALNQIIYLLNESNMKTEIKEICNVADSYYLYAIGNLSKPPSSDLTNETKHKANNFLKNFDKLAELKIKDPNDIRNELEQTNDNIDQFVRLLQEIRSTYDPTVLGMVDGMIQELRNLKSYLDNIIIMYETCSRNLQDVKDFGTPGTINTSSRGTIQETIKALIDLLNIDLLHIEV